MAKEVMGEKRGQITIWVIVALALVAAIALFFILRGRVTPIEEGLAEENPKSFISACVKKSINEAVDKMLPQGGAISPEHSKIYKNINVSYLCYNSGNYHPCINERPMLLSEMEEEIRKYAEPKIEKCFESYKSEMEKRQATIELGVMNFSVRLGAENIYAELKREVSIRQKEESYNVDNFDVSLMSPLYDIGRVAMEIASQEAEYCYFEYVGYMILYPKFKIDLDTMSDSTKIYSIKEKRSGKEMNIAIRSCAIPAGL